MGTPAKQIKVSLWSFQGEKEGNMNPLCADGSSPRVSVLFHSTDQLIPWLLWRPQSLPGKSNAKWNKYRRLNKLWITGWESRDKGIYDFPHGASYLNRIVSQPLTCFSLFKWAPQADYFDGNTMLRDPDYKLFFTPWRSLSLSLSMKPETNLTSSFPLSRVPQCSYREVRMGFFLTFTVFNSDISPFWIFLTAPLPTSSS